MYQLSETKTYIFNELLAHFEIKRLITGVSGGLVSTLVLHPLDLLKIRFAVNDGQLKTRPNYRSLGNAVSTIIREEGFRGLYRGVIPSCWGAGASWGFYFLFYEAIKTRMTYSNDSSQVNLGPGSYMLAAAAAGLITSCMTNPIWVIKTRLCLQYQSSTVFSSLPKSKHYSGMHDAISKIYHSEGIPGFYRGLVPGLFGVSHGALYFMMYEEMKNKYISYYHLTSEDKLGTTQYLLFSSLSKLFAASLTYPHQVIKTRLQDQHKSYSGVFDVIQRIWKYEGAKGYYKGIVPNLLRVTPATAITLVVYETSSKYLLKK